MLATLAAPGAFAQDSGDSCTTTGGGNACGIIFQGTPGTDHTDAGGDDNGIAGGPGQSGPNLSHTFTPGTQQTYTDAGASYAIGMQSAAGRGGNGSNASGNFTESGLAGGVGGTGGNAGNLDLTVGEGVTVQGTQNLAIYMLNQAGNGGSTGANGFTDPPAPLLGGNPGSAGSINATINGTVTSQGAAVGIVSAGGSGGNGNNSEDGRSKFPPYGQNGSQGGDITVSVGGSVTGFTAAGAGLNPTLLATSYGGDGGNGGSVDYSADGGQGGNGGNGAAGGTVTVTVNPGGQVVSQVSNQYVPAVLAQSLGGIGGAAGTSGSGGKAGTGGDGGAVTVVINGTAVTESPDSPGVLAQSMGGVGAGGGRANLAGGSGGDGGTGGNGGVVSISGTGGSIFTGRPTAPGVATNSSGVLAQSIGGGGGAGGDANEAAFSVGGSGATGANGGTVAVDMANAITTLGPRSHGVHAQSIGGGGGTGGDSRGASPGFSLQIGGTGGAGGNGGSVGATNAVRLALDGSGLLVSGSITTDGSHAVGMLLQSVGGGGGSGGAAYSQSAGLAGDASVAIGGAGGVGGAGGTVGFAPNQATTNAGSIVTSGNDGFGLLAQSLGGGGGHGGAAAASARAYAVPGNDGIPTVSLAVSLGGAGGAGGAGGSVTLDNTGLIATRGAGGAAMVAQSIGGGGGSGGDSSAHASAQGSSSFNLSATMSVGGTGSGGGAGGNASVSNRGLIVTTGESADGMLVQSIGGGGGNGGSGDGQARSSGDGTNVSLALNMGGGCNPTNPKQCNGGGDGGSATATNAGAILTLGDGAVGILAQSVGGGGGRGGGGAGTSTGDYSAAVNVGGAGGTGGNTWQGPSTNSVTVVNTGSIVTFGADAPGIVAQSIGGGGGSGGKAASRIGGNSSTGDGGNGNAATTAPAVASVQAAFAAGGVDALNGYNSTAGLTALANSLLGNTTVQGRRLGDTASDADGLSNLDNSAGESGDDSEAKSINLNVAVGGRGGTGGSAGVVSVTNSGSIGTVGAMSDGILAQAIGGGGGRGGAAISSTSNQDVQGALGVGGTGGGGGNGAPVTVTNSGSIITVGGLSAGIVAQSIAGGGGIGGHSGARVKPSDGGDTLGLPLSIGGNGGGGGTAGQAYVTNDGSIVTRGHDAIGIIAQSIAGGGGIVRTLARESTSSGGDATARGSDYAVNLTFGGSAGAAGDANHVFVANNGSITTGYVVGQGNDAVHYGRNAHGILAQSIGGGGGLVLGGKPANGANPFGTGLMSGNAGGINGDGTPNVAQGIVVNNTGSVATNGDGAVGILAQSIGGGGGLAGDTAWTQQLVGFAQSGTHAGSGGPVTITVVNPNFSAASVTTSGYNAPAILAQSIGGGGGRVSNTGGAYNGSAGGTGNGGPVSVFVGSNAIVQAGGNASPGIYAASEGRGGAGTPGSIVNVSIDDAGHVMGGKDVAAGDAAGVIVDSGSNDASQPNTVRNNGTLGSANGTGGFAVTSAVGNTQVINGDIVGSRATMTGSIRLTDRGGSGSVNNQGTWNTGTVADVGRTGTITNGGTLNIGGSGRVATTAMTGTLVQTGTGRLVVDTNHRTGEADRLDVQGAVRLGGTLEVRPASVANRAVTVLTASEGVTLDPGLTSTRTHLFRFEAQQAGNAVQIQPRAEFTAQASALGANQQAVASHLQEVWNSGVPLGTSGFDTLAAVSDGGSYSRSLNTLSGQTVGAIAAFRYASSHAFTTSMLDDCPTYGGAGLSQEQSTCVWSRAFGSSTDQGSTGSALGYRATAFTIQGGGQRQVAPGLFLGGALSYETSEFRGDAGTSKVTGDTLSLGATIRYQTGPWQFSGVLDAGYGWYDSSRTVEVGSYRATASASPTAWHAGAHARAAYQFAFPGAPGAVVESWYVQPRVDLHLNYVRSGGYTETGSSPFNLAVQREGATTFAAVPAVEVGARVRVGEGLVLRPFASAGVSLNANSDWAATARFAGQPNSRGFRTSTPIPDVLAKVTAGVEVLTGANWDVRVGYSGEFGDRYTSHTGTARIAYRF